MLPSPSLSSLSPNYLHPPTWPAFERWRRCGSPREVVPCHRGVDQFLRYSNEPAPLFNFSRLRKKCWNNSNNDSNNNSENEGKLGYRGRWKEILTCFLHVFAKRGPVERFLSRERASFSLIGMTSNGQTIKRRWVLNVLIVNARRTKMNFFSTMKSVHVFLCTNVEMLRNVKNENSPARTGWISFVYRAKSW